MKRNALLASAALALIIGTVPAISQTSTRDGVKDQPPRSEVQREDTRQPSHSQNETTEQQPGSATKADSRDDKAANQQRQSSERTTKPSSNTTRDTGTQNNKTATDRDRQPAEQRQQSTQTDRGAAQPSTNNATSTKSSGTNTASQRNAPSNTNQTRVSASLDPQKKERLSAAIGRLDASPVSRVDFSISVGTVVPTHVSLRPLPTTIVEIVPQYRGYDFFVVREEIVIVEPRTHKIVDVIERSGPSHARAQTRERITLSDKQREVIRKHVSSRRVTTGSSRREIEIEVGKRLPATVEIESFPEEVYREVPEIRSYRYIEHGGEVYLVNPSDREVIEEIR